MWFFAGVLQCTTTGAVRTQHSPAPSTAHTEPQATAVQLQPSFTAESIALFEQQRARCREQDYASCYATAELYARGRGVHADERESSELHQFACDNGYMPSCVRQAERLLYEGSEESMAHARATLSRLCPQSTDACAVLANALRIGLGGPSDQERSDRMIELACPQDLGSNGCAQWALFFVRHAQSDPRVLRRATLSCEQHIGMGCRAYALILQANRQLTQARTTLESACADDDGPSCALLATLVQQEDRDRAQLLWSRACVGLRPAAGCAEWADSRRDTITPVERRELLALSCNNEGNEDACAEVSRSFIESEIFDDATVRAMVSRTCHERNDRGCALMAQLNSTRRGHANRSEVEALFRRGCDSGDLAGCTAFGAWLRTHSRVGDARAVWGRTCRLHYARACRQLAEALAPPEHPGSNVPVRARARAYEWAIRGCVLNDGPSCEMASRFATATRDARALRQRACHLGEADACGRQ